MDKTVDYAYFTRKMFIRSVLPAPLAALGLALAEIGDTILVGHAIGMDGLAAIGFIPLGMAAGWAVPYLMRMFFLHKKMYYFHLCLRFLIFLNLFYVYYLRVVFLLSLR